MGTGAGEPLQHSEREPIEPSARSVNPRIVAPEKERADPLAVALKKVRRQERKKGATEAEIDAILAGVRRGGASEEGQNSYPTPDSVEHEPGDTEIDPTVLKEALKDLPDGLVNDQLLKEVVGEDESVEQPWAGFWNAGWMQMEYKSVETAPPNLIARKRDIYGIMLAEAVRQDSE